MSKSDLQSPLQVSEGTDLTAYCEESSKCTQSTYILTDNNVSDASNQNKKSVFNLFLRRQSLTNKYLVLKEKENLRCKTSVPSKITPEKLGCDSEQGLRESYPVSDTTSKWDHKFSAFLTPLERERRYLSAADSDAVQEGLEKQWTKDNKIHKSKVIYYPYRSRTVEVYPKSNINKFTDSEESGYSESLYKGSGIDSVVSPAVSVKVKSEEVENPMSLVELYKIKYRPF